MRPSSHVLRPPSEDITGIRRRSSLTYDFPFYMFFSSFFFIIILNVAIKFIDNSVQGRQTRCRGRKKKRKQLAGADVNQLLTGLQITAIKYLKKKIPGEEFKSTGLKTRNEYTGLDKYLGFLPVHYFNEPVILTASSHNHPSSYSTARSVNEILTALLQQNFIF